MLNAILLLVCAATTTPENAGKDAAPLGDTTYVVMQVKIKPPAGVTCGLDARYPQIGRLADRGVQDRINCLLHRVLGRTTCTAQEEVEERFYVAIQRQDILVIDYYEERSGPDCGAHGQSIDGNLIIDMKTGTRIDLMNQFKEGFATTLTELVIEALRTEPFVPVDRAFSDVLQDVRSGQESYHLKLEGNGIRAYFAPYQLDRARVDGALEVHVPWQKIANWIVPGSPLQSLARLPRRTHSSEDRE